MTFQVIPPTLYLTFPFVPLTLHFALPLDLLFMLPLSLRLALPLDFTFPLALSFALLLFTLPLGFYFPLSARFLFALPLDLFFMLPLSLYFPLVAGFPLSLFPLVPGFAFPFISFPFLPLCFKYHGNRSCHVNVEEFPVLRHAVAVLFKPGMDVGFRPFAVLDIGIERQNKGRGDRGRGGKLVDPVARVARRPSDLDHITQRRVGENVEVARLSGSAVLDRNAAPQAFAGVCVRLEERVIVAQLLQGKTGGFATI